ncbi:hypothetical protein SRHO_G00227260 [Serrasalmus rhombeus]
MSRNLKSAACGDIKRHQCSHGQETAGDQDGGNAPEMLGAPHSHDLGQDIGNIFAALTKISSDLEGLEEIRHSTSSVEAKISALITRIEEVEKRVEFLESVEKDREADPLARKTDISLLWEKLEDMENRSRHNNVHLIGVPEGKEGADAVKFVEELILQLLEMEKKCEIEQAHRVSGPRPTAGDRPRPLLARFLQSSDREKVLRAAKDKGKLCWENNNIMLFPDNSKATQMKWDKFKECKKKLHEWEVRFRLLYPAKLKIETKLGAVVGWSLESPAWTTEGSGLGHKSGHCNLPPFEGLDDEVAAERTAEEQAEGRGWEVLGGCWPFSSSGFHLYGGISQRQTEDRE